MIWAEVTSSSRFAEDESPRWDGRTGQLTWVDLTPETFHPGSLANGTAVTEREYLVSERIGCAAALEVRRYGPKSELLTTALAPAGRSTAVAIAATTLIITSAGAGISDRADLGGHIFLLTPGSPPPPGRIGEVTSPRENHERRSQ